MGRLMSKISLPVVLMLFVSSVCADTDDHERVRSLMDAGEIVSADVLIKDAQQRMPSGRLLELELEHEDGRYVYEIEMVDDGGVVWEFYYDAKTEEFIRRTKED